MKLLCPPPLPALVLPPPPLHQLLRPPPSLNHPRHLSHPLNTPISSLSAASLEETNATSPRISQEYEWEEEQQKRPCWKWPHSTFTHQHPCCTYVYEAGRVQPENLCFCSVMWLCFMRFTLRITFFAVTRTKFVSSPSLTRMCVFKGKVDAKIKQFYENRASK